MWIQVEMNDQLALAGLVGGKGFDLINYENFNTIYVYFAHFFL